ncbi:MAG: TerC family protein [Acidobacteria bacterium]|nr:TerC family protein [Acidobacteriota bacterium]
MSEIINLFNLLNLKFVVSFLSITLIDIVLAGDNAVVIGMAAMGLPPENRRKVILAGAGLAIGLRVITTAFVSHLLRVPLLSAVGGVLVGWIAVKLLREQKELEAAPEKGARSIWHAIWIIAVADFVMSTDNIIAIGGASRGNFGLILFGLALSIPIIMFCASWIARLLEKYQSLVYAGAGVLAWTAGMMIVDDRTVNGFFDASDVLFAHLGVPALFVVMVVFLGRRRWPLEG